MRNLKRVLSLAMAAAMLIGMMVISAGAASTYEDFTDKDEIQNTEAVKTMVSLGVINGKDDGSYFDPNGIVTRGEMAALIARSLNGGIDPSLGTGAAATQFSDTKGHWAEPYIAYCANLGIINGKGDGTFGPDEQVTGTAAAKMFLCALGYRSEIEGLTGAGWDLNTDTLSNKVGLYDGMSTLRPSDGLNRDNTAQLIYNGVQANEVAYRNNYGEYSGVIYAQPINSAVTDSQGNTVSSTMLSIRFGVVKVVGTVLGNEFFTLDGAPQRTGKTRLNILEKNFYGDVSAEVTFNVSTDAELIGQKVVLYVKPSSKLSPNPANDAVLGDAIIADSNVVVTTTDRYTTYTNTTFNKFLSSNGLKVGDDTESYINYDAQYVTKVNSDAADTEANVGDIIENRRGTELTVIDYNDDGVVDYLLAIERTLARVSVYNTSKNELTLSNGDKYDFDDVVGIDDIAGNDYILYFQDDDGNAYVEKVEPVTATLESYVANSTVTLDGTTYNMAYAGGMRDHTDLDKISDLTRFNNTNAKPDAHPMNDEMKVSVGTAAGDMELGETYDLYLDKAGNIIAYEPADTTAGNYALVLETVRTTDSMNSNPEGRVSLLLADGTRVSGVLDIEGTQKNYKQADSAMTTPRAFADKYVAKSINGYNPSGAALPAVGGDADDAATDAEGKGSLDTSLLAGTIVTYSETNGTYVLKPTSMIRSTGTQWQTWKPVGPAASKNASVTGNVVKNMASLKISDTYKADGTNNGAATIIVNENTVFLFAYGEFGTEKTTMIQGTKGLGSTVLTATAVAYNNRTNVARVVYVAADSGTSSSNYSYVDKSATVRNIDGTTRYVYESVNKDGEFVELITDDNTITESGIYKVTTDGKGISTLEASAATTNTTNYLAASNTAGSIVDGEPYDMVAGRISAIDGGVVTVEDDSNRKFPVNVSGLEGIYVDDAAAPAKVSLSVGQKVMISFKKDSDKPMAEAVFVTELFSDEIQPYAAAPTVKVKSAVAGNALTLAETTLTADGTVTATGSAFANNTGDKIDVAIDYAANTVVDTAGATVKVGSNAASATLVNVDVGDAPGTVTIVVTVPVKDSRPAAQTRAKTYTYTLTLTTTAGTPIAEDATGSDINTALTSGDAFIAPESGTYTAVSGIDVPTGKTLTIKGNLDESAQAITTTGTGKVVVEGNYIPNATSTANVEVAGNLALGEATTITGDVTAAAVTGAYALTLNDAGAKLTVAGNIANNLVVTNANTVTVDGTITGTLSVAAGTVTVNEVTDATTVTGGTLNVTGNTGAINSNAGTGVVNLKGATAARAADLTVTSVNMTAGTLNVTSGNVAITTVAALPSTANIKADATLTLGATASAELVKLAGEDETSTLVLTADSSDTLTQGSVDATAKFWLTAGTANDDQGASGADGTIPNSSGAAAIPAGTYTWTTAYHSTDSTQDSVTAWVKQATV